MINKLSIPSIPPNADLGVSNFMNSSVNLYKQVGSGLGSISVAVHSVNSTLAALQTQTNNLSSYTDDVVTSFNKLNAGYEAFKIEIYERLAKLEAEYESNKSSVESRSNAVEAKAHTH